MSTVKFHILFSFIFIFLFPNYLYGEIVFPWKTTFDYNISCSPRGYDPENDTPCADIEDDGVNWTWDHDGNPKIPGYYSAVVPEANHDAGDGGMGFRVWKDDGSNQCTATANLFFSPQKELWVRWYVRYEEGFSWENGYGGNPQGDKIIRLRTSGTNVHSLFRGYSFALRPEVSMYGNIRSSEDFNWVWLMGGAASDGEWHCFEMHVVMDSGQNGYDEPSDGIGRLWVNGVLVIDDYTVNYSAGDVESLEGWNHLMIADNQHGVDNGEPMYVDFDDVVIYAQNPPNTDAHGNAFIGPIGWDSELPVLEGLSIIE